ncbi:MAG: hypothetical protein U0528_09330 [Anaerolineae bacterium]
MPTVKLSAIRADVAITDARCWLIARAANRWRTDLQARRLRSFFVDVPGNIPPVVRRDRAATRGGFPSPPAFHLA